MVLTTLLIRPTFWTICTLTLPLLVIFCRTNIQQIQAETPIFTIQNNSIFYISDSYGFEDHETAQNRKKVQVFKEGTKTQIAVDNLLTSERINSVSMFDGLGRPLQQVTVAGSPSQIDVVQPFVYDTIGRERFKYLPYTSTTAGIYKSNPLAAQLAFYTSQANVVHDAPLCLRQYLITHP